MGLNSGEFRDVSDAQKIAILPLPDGDGESLDLGVAARYPANIGCIARVQVDLVEPGATLVGGIRAS